MTGPADPRVEIPDELVSWHRKFFEGDYTMWHTEPDRAIARILLERP